MPTAAGASEPSSVHEDPALRIALLAMAPDGIAIGHRLIALGDEDTLRPAELERLRGRATHVRRQSGAARIVARALLAGGSFLDLAAIEPAIPSDTTGAPVWPAGVVGSLAHDTSVAVAAIARVDRFSMLGIDVEPSEPLPDNLVDIVTTPGERAAHSGEVLAGRLFFAAKEAIFKACHPFDGRFLDFADIEIDLAAMTGATRHGHRLALAAITQPRVVVLAFG